MNSQPNNPAPTPNAPKQWKPTWRTGVVVIATIVTIVILRSCL
ncbi:MAG TPA: hypothetical protein VGO11_21360 [Chthoniobacteraceae bacterium]|nr:hypothetical protein [Chthoniobacteraceae bacterium]